MAGRGASARNKGTSFERTIAQWWRDLGWCDCKTSRFESKMLDDQCVDLTNTYPFNCQLKATERLGSYHTELAKMPDNSNMNILMHKRNRQGVIVAMTLEDFKEILMMLKANKII